MRQLLREELDALQIWLKAKGLPADVRQGMQISCDKIRGALAREDWIIAVGDVRDGFAFVGPFPDNDSASEYGQGYEAVGTTWLPVQLEEPDAP